MKKLILSTLFLFGIAISSYSQIQLSCYFDDFWGEWVQVKKSIQIYGGYSGFFIYDNEKGGKWNPMFKFSINDFKVPNEKQRKKDVKADKWYIFSGTVEYYVPVVENNALSIYEIFKITKSPTLIDKSTIEENGNKAKKVVSNATIKIKAFKNLPDCYNISFDDVQLGIYMNGTRFNNVKFD